MMQSILTVLIVAAAALWLLRRAYLTFRAAIGLDPDAVGQCSACPRNPAVAQAPVVQLGVLRTASANGKELR